MEETDDFSSRLTALTAKPTHASDDIERLRQAFYREGAVDRRRAAEIVHANRGMQTCNDEWAEFFLESLTGFFLKCEGNHVVMSADSEKTLLSWLGDAASVIDPGERRLALRIFLKAEEHSAHFETWMLDAIRDNLLHHSVRWCGGKPRTAGVIDVMDIQLVRRLMMGDGRQPRKAISPGGVDFLVDLDRSATEILAPERWRRLLVDCLARSAFAEPFSGCEATPTDEAGALGALAERLSDRYSPEEAARLKADVLLTRAWTMPANQKHPTHFTM